MAVRSNATRHEMTPTDKFKDLRGRTTKVERLLEADPDLKCAYKLMHLFRDWLDMTWCAKKRDSLISWMSLAIKSGIPEMKRAAKSIKRNREGVLAGYKFNKTNATAEGLNNSIKVMKRMSYGFKSFERMRRRCLLSLGYMRIIKRGIKINGVKFEDPRS
ncbi:transposase [Adlercreutzia sp. ZJ154]|uniref:transposase n=1 Tax=Adlercreutzia sp. ZJ154 TaxID=2709790 RepID=UPI0013ED7A46|nr:transposase [Adlercreutzia sp. ZJ154]